MGISNKNQCVLQQNLSDYKKVSTAMRVFTKLQLLVLYRIVQHEVVNFIPNMFADHFRL